MCKSAFLAAVVTHIFKAFVRVVDPNPYCQLSLKDATADEYVTRHSLDGTIIFADHRYVNFICTSFYKICYFVRKS